MRETYRKRGRGLRYENGVFVRVTEAGEAIEEGGRFRCAPLRDAVPLPEIDSVPLRETVNRLRSSIPATVERLVAADGIAEHEFGERSWRDSSRRIHLSLVRDTHRVLLDEGSFDLRQIERVATLLSRAGLERDAPARLRLAPRVVAAITPMLMAIAPPNVTIEQRGGGVDAKGLPVEQAQSAPWPNWYRPSYRIRPRRAALNVVARCSVTTIDAALPEAVALLAPPAGLDLRLLCVDGGQVFPAVFRLSRIDAIAEPTTWYPVETGVWAGEAEVA